MKLNKIAKTSIRPLICGLVMLSSPITLAGVELPASIATPTINFELQTPSRPEQWEGAAQQEVAGFYYIDFSNGHDSHRYGMPNAPRKTLPNPIPAGSYVEIAGEYTYGVGGSIKVHAAGTKAPWVAGASGPVWLVSSPEKQAVFKKYRTVVWGENIYIDGIQFKEHTLQVGSASPGYAAENVVIRNNEISGTTEMDSNLSLLSVVADETSPIQNVVIYNNTVHTAGDINSPIDIDAGLINISGYSSYVWVLNNEGYNASGSGLSVSAHKPMHATHHIYGANNEIYNVRQAGIGMKFATDVVFANNYIHDIITTDWSPSKGIGGQYQPHRVILMNNVIANAEYGIRFASTYDSTDEVPNGLDAYIVGNIIYNISTEKERSDNNTWDYAGISLNGMDNRYVYNNLIVNATNGINVSNLGNKTDIRNNIITNVKGTRLDGSKGNHLYFNGFDERVTLANNFFDKTELSIRFGLNYYHDVDSLDILTNRKNYSADVLASFSDVMTTAQQGIDLEYVWDYGSQLDSSFYQLMNALSVGYVDANEQTRISGNAIDIGPFESVGENHNATPPLAPSDLTLSIR